jgi:hypothetical protein
MTNQPGDMRPLEDPERQLERAFIDEFLHGRGYDAAALHALAPEERDRLLREASVYAGTKLTEVEARAHYVSELRGGA